MACPSTYVRGSLATPLRSRNHNDDGGRFDFGETAWWSRVRDKGKEGERERTNLSGRRQRIYIWYKYITHIHAIDSSRGYIKSALESSDSVATVSWCSSTSANCTPRKLRRTERIGKKSIYFKSGPNISRDI